MMVENTEQKDERCELYYVYSNGCQNNAERNGRDNNSLPYR